MKRRRHHNNKGLKQIKRGKTHKQVERIAKKLNIPLGPLPAPNDYRIANRPDNPNWRGVKAWFAEAIPHCQHCGWEIRLTNGKWQHDNRDSTHPAEPE